MIKLLSLPMPCQWVAKAITVFARSLANQLVCKKLDYLELNQLYLSFLSVTVISVCHISQNVSWSYFSPQCYWSVFWLWLLCLSKPQIKLLFSAEDNWFFFLISLTTYCGYSLEAPHWGASNEYQQYMFCFFCGEIRKKYLHETPASLRCFYEYLQYMFFMWRNKIRLFTWNPLLSEAH